MSTDRLVLQNFIGGRLCAAASGRTLDVFEPATGEVYAVCPASDETDVDAAVAAARAAAPSWAATPPAQRARAMERLAALLEERAADFAIGESRDNGKPLALARTVDIPRAVSNLRFFAAAASQFASESHAMPGQAINYTLRQPLGVVACISPWNLPLYLFTWKIAPALAAGNTVVAKPSELTPYTAWLLCHLCQEAGLPPGVLNVVHGLGADVGEPLVRHPRIAAVSFTGGTVTGRRIAAVSSDSFRKLSLEMGGKNASIVFADCDFERSVDTVMRAAFTNQGEICLCGSRILVEESIYERFRSALVERILKLRVGDPMEAATDQGALVSSAHRDKVLGFIERARSDGAEILCGGHAVEVPGRCANGWFLAPTLIEATDPACALNQDEVFGPVASIMPFRDETHALELANSTRYGLACSLWTQDLSRAHRMAEQIASGIVWVNCWMLRDLRTPFGGMRESGMGREGGLEAMRFFTEAKNVCVAFE